MIDRRLFVRGLSAAVATASTLVTESALAQQSKADAETTRQIARTTENSPFRLGIIGPGS
ncbi:MAG: gfo/Idh/MocA family oxidoreductase, partial [Edaphobacter sp.]|nr:gfo/Idh/MocA family oxidoreductase [Edaphobacter sp.]